jgi:colanic acid biosynthesis glycosyl transferase WcaI
MSESRLRPAVSSDIESIAKVHEAAFPEFFMTRMGRRFLREYYLLVLDYPDGLMLVSGQESEVEGFVAGFVNPAKFYAYLSGRRRRLFWPSLMAIFRQPQLLPRVLYNRKRVASASVQDEPGSCELSSIGVLPGSAGRGHGRRLIDGFCVEARRRGCMRIVLTTDLLQNDAVNAFYRRNGFTLERSFASGGKRWMNEYVRLLSTDGGLSGDHPE